MPGPRNSQIRNMGDFSATFRFELIIVEFPAALGGQFVSEDFNLRCETIELPKRLNTEVEIRLHGQKVKVPGISEPNGILTFTFIETVDAKISAFIKAWRDVIWAPDTGVQQPTSDVKGTFLLRLLNNRNEPYWEYRVIGAWLQDNEAGGTPDGSTGDPLRPTLTFSFDDFEDRAL